MIFESFQIVTVVMERRAWKESSLKKYERSRGKREEGEIRRDLARDHLLKKELAITPCMSSIWRELQWKYLCHSPALLAGYFQANERYLLDKTISIQLEWYIHIDGRWCL